MKSGSLYFFRFVVSVVFGVWHLLQLQPLRPLQFHTFQHVCCTWCLTPSGCFPGPSNKAKAEYIELIEQERAIKSEYGLVPIKDDQKLKDALDFILSTLGFSERVVESIQRGEKTTKFKTERDQFMATAYHAGFSVKEIAEYLSLSYEGVRKIVVVKGV